MTPPQVSPRTEPRPATSSPTEPEEATATRVVGDDIPSLDDQALKDGRQSLDAMGQVCTPVLFGLLTPGGLGGLLLLAWLLFA